MKKILLYSLLAVSVVGLVGASAVSAQGFFHNHAMNSEGKESQGGYEKMLENKAEIFGLSVDQLKTAKEEGKTFCEIAEDQGLSMEELRAQMQEKKQELRAQKIEGRKAHIEELIANGTITQEQAGEKLEWLENREGRGKMLYRNGGEGRFMNCQQDNL
jgi:competence protein ComGC